MAKPKRRRIIIEESGLVIRPSINKRIHEMRKELGYIQETKQHVVGETNHDEIWERIKSDLNNLQNS
jgi:hypothetical protein